MDMLLYIVQQNYDSFKKYKNIVRNSLLYKKLSLEYPWQDDLYIEQVTMTIMIFNKINI